MQIFDVLTDEHDRILRALDVFDAMAGRLEAGDPVPGADVQAMVGFVRRYADACHHAKEEKVLFPALEARGIPREGGPIGVMLMEHDEGRALVTAICDQADGLASSEEARRQCAAAVRSFSGMLRAHIRKENDILYVMGAARISPHDAEGLLADYETYEGQEIKPGEKDDLLATLADLERTYYR